MYSAGRHEAPRCVLRDSAKYAIASGTAPALSAGVILSPRYIPRLAATPVVPLAIGAVLGALVNYAGSALWVFGAKRSGS